MIVNFFLFLTTLIAVVYGFPVPPESGLAFSATVRDYETHPALRLDERYVILPSPSSTLAIPAIPASASPVPPLSSSSLQVKIETRSLQRRQEPEDEASEADSRPPPRAAAAYKHLVSSPPSEPEPEQGADDAGEDGEGFVPDSE